MRIALQSEYTGMYIKGKGWTDDISKATLYRTWSPFILLRKILCRSVYKPILSKKVELVKVAFNNNITDILGDYRNYARRDDE